MTVPGSDTDVFLICALGNPGLEYSNTRHNAGFIFADRFVEKLNFPQFRFCEKINGEITAGSIEGCNLIVLKPLTFMNRSGLAVKKAMEFFPVKENGLIVVHDDADLNFGFFRIKTHGGSGGHNGIRSIESEIGTDRFIRVKIGVGKPNLNMDMADYVLSNFLDEESDLINNSLSLSWDKIILKIIEDGVAEAMNVFNRRDKQNV